MKYLLGIDFGGGASKATLLCEDGNICATANCEYKTIYPQSGYVEQNPNDWVDAACKNIKSVLMQSGVNPCDICALSFDAATHTAVVMDKDFNVIRNSIYWTDIRSLDEVNYLKENYAEIIEKQVPHKPSTIWTLPELMWIKNDESENWSKVKKILFAKDYVRHFFTGDYVTDYIEAEGSMMFDINTMEWSRELCGILEIDTAMMPKIVKPTDIVGEISKEAATITGLCEGTPVICGTTDTVMEVFAGGAVNKDDVTVKLATAGRICVITDKPYPHRDLVNYSHIADGLWYPGTATKSAAASYRWYRDTFGGNYKDLDKDAMNVPIGCEGLRFHPYLNGELSPYADPTLCGSFTGVRATHTKAHFTRAVLEGVCFALLDSRSVLDEVGIKYSLRATAIGGGTKGEFWRQICADVLGMTLRTVESSDSSFGSAMLAGVAVGVFENPKDAVQKCVKFTSETKPNPENTEKYRKIFAEYKKIHDALAPIYSAR